jgi:hypothetical protein
VNWLSVSSGPWGSRISAVFVHSVSSDEIATAPSLSAVAVDSSRDATVKVAYPKSGV